MTPDEIVKEAEEMLKRWPTPPGSEHPDWSPYYWRGRRDAAKEINESKNREGNQ
jgi:hypothetical protein